MASNVDVTVIGAGPAGMTASITAGRLGLRSVVLDEGAQPGGQFFRQPLTQAAAQHSSKTVRQGAALARQMRASGSVLVSGAEVFDINAAGASAVCGGKLLPAPAPIILAPGATERVVPVPGWTLPGVLSCGGAQALAKSQGVVFGERVVVAGSGPFLLPVAVQLASLGADVRAIVEAAHLGARAVARLAAVPQRFIEGLGYVMPLVRRRTSFLVGHAVTRIEGVSRTERVVIHRLDSEGHAMRGTARSVECDSVCLSDGFLPATELAELAGVRVRWEPHTRTWAAESETPSAASPGNIFCAGSTVRGLGGAQLAAVSGELAAYTVAERLGVDLSKEDHARRVRASRAADRHSAFAAVLERIYPTRPAWYARTTPETIVCRCEDVTAGAVSAAALDGGGDVTLVKAWTRAGMGLCQGRTCGATLIELTARACDLPAFEVGRLRARPPVRPVPLQVLAAHTQTEACIAK